MIIITIILSLVLGFLMKAGLVWLLCWALNAIGIVTICGITVSFSWALVLAIWVISTLLRGIFRINIESKIYSYFSGQKHG